MRGLDRQLHWLARASVEVGAEANIELERLPRLNLLQLHRDTLCVHHRVRHSERRAAVIADCCREVIIRLPWAGRQLNWRWHRNQGGLRHYRRMEGEHRQAGA